MNIEEFRYLISPRICYCQPGSADAPDVGQVDISGISVPSGIAAPGVASGSAPSQAAMAEAISADIAAGGQADVTSAAGKAAELAAQAHIAETTTTIQQQTTQIGKGHTEPINQEGQVNISRGLPIPTNITPPGTLSHSAPSLAAMPGVISQSITTQENIPTALGYAMMVGRATPQATLESQVARNNINIAKNQMEDVYYSTGKGWEIQSNGKMTYGGKSVSSVTHDENGIPVPLFGNVPASGGEVSKKYRTGAELPMIGKVLTGEALMNSLVNKGYEGDALLNAYLASPLDSYNLPARFSETETGFFANRAILAAVFQEYGDVSNESIAAALNSGKGISLTETGYQLTSDPIAVQDPATGAWKAKDENGKEIVSTTPPLIASAKSLQTLTSTMLTEALRQVYENQQPGKVGASTPAGVLSSQGYNTAATQVGGITFLNQVITEKLGQITKPTLPKTISELLSAWDLNRIDMVEPTSEAYKNYRALVNKATEYDISTQDGLRSFQEDVLNSVNPATGFAVKDNSLNLQGQVFRSPVGDFVKNTSPGFAMSIIHDNTEDLVFRNPLDKFGGLVVASTDNKGVLESWGAYNNKHPGLGLSTEVKVVIAPLIRLLPDLIKSSTGESLSALNDDIQRRIDVYVKDGSLTPMEGNAYAKYIGDIRGYEGEVYTLEDGKVVSITLPSGKTLSSEDLRAMYPDIKLPTSVSDAASKVFGVSKEHSTIQMLKSGDNVVINNVVVGEDNAESVYRQAQETLKKDKTDTNAQMLVQLGNQHVGNDGVFNKSGFMIALNRNLETYPNKYMFSGQYEKGFESQLGKEIPVEKPPYEKGKTLRTEGVSISKVNKVDANKQAEKIFNATTPFWEALPASADTPTSNTLGKNTTPYFDKNIYKNVMINPSPDLIDTSVKSGRPVIIMISAPGCHPCTVAVKDLDYSADKMAHADIYVITADSGWSKASDPALQGYFESTGAFPSLAYYVDGKKVVTSKQQKSSMTATEAITKASKFEYEGIKEATATTTVATTTEKPPEKSPEFYPVKLNQVLDVAETKTTAQDSSINIHDVKVDYQDGNVIVTWKTDKPIGSLVMGCHGAGCAAWKDATPTKDHRIVITDAKDYDGTLHLTTISNPLLTVNDNVIQTVDVKQPVSLNPFNLRLARTLPFADQQMQIENKNKELAQQEEQRKQDAIIKKQEIEQARIKAEQDKVDPIKILEKHTDDKGVSIVGALKDGINPDFLKGMNFDPTYVEDVLKVITNPKFSDLIFPSGQVDARSLVKAGADDKTLKSIGVTPTQISQAKELAKIPDQQYIDIINQNSSSQDQLKYVGTLSNGAIVAFKQSDYNQLPDVQKDIISTQGVDAWKNQVANWERTLDDNGFKRPDGGFDIAGAILYSKVGDSREVREISDRRPAEAADIRNKATSVGMAVNGLFANELIVKVDKQITEEKTVHLDDVGKIINETWKSMTPWNEDIGQQPTLAATGQLGAEMLLPLVYTIGRWDSLSPSEQVLSGGMDLLSIMPVVGAGARAMATAKRAGMSMSEAMGRVALAEITSPAYMVAHPLETIKAPYYMVKEVVKLNQIPPEVLIGSLYNKLGTFGSDLKLIVGAGGEVSGATQEAMRSLVEQALKGNGEAMQGLMMVRQQGTGMSKILDAAGEAPVVGHATPQLENIINDAKKMDVGGKEVDYFEVKDSKEKGMFFTPESLSNFYLESATGKSGQIMGGVFNQTRLFQDISDEVLALRDAEKIWRRLLELQNEGKLVRPVPVPKQFHKWIEQEIEKFVHPVYGKIVIVPSTKTTTFKFNVPEPTIEKQALEYYNQAIGKMEQINGLKGKDVPDLVKQGLINEYNDAYSKYINTYQEAVKQGTPVNVKKNWDVVEFTDQVTGKNGYILHTTTPEELASGNVKAWNTNFKRMAEMKVKGWLNIPRDIVEPALYKPNISAEVQEARIREKFIPSEQNRFDAGFVIRENIPDIKTIENGGWYVKNVPDEGWMKDLLLSSSVMTEQAVGFNKQIQSLINANDLVTLDSALKPYGLYVQKFNSKDVLKLDPKYAWTILPIPKTKNDKQAVTDTIKWLTDHMNLKTKATVGIISSIPSGAVKEIDDYIRAHDKIKLYGSFNSALQNPRFIESARTPGDLDFSSNVPDIDVFNIAQIVRKYDPTTQLINTKAGNGEPMWRVQREIDGVMETIIEGHLTHNVNIDQYYKRLVPSGKVVNVDGFMCQPLEDEIRNALNSTMMPGYGVNFVTAPLDEIPVAAGRGGKEYMGVHASGRDQRLKDIAALKSNVDWVIEGLKKTSNDAKADVLQKALDKFLGVEIETEISAGKRILGKVAEEYNADTIIDMADKAADTIRDDEIYLRSMAEREIKGELSTGEFRDYIISITKRQPEETLVNYNKEIDRLVSGYDVTTGPSAQLAKQGLMSDNEYMGFVSRWHKTVFDVDPTQGYIDAALRDYKTNAQQAIENLNNTARNEAIRSSMETQFRKSVRDMPYQKASIAAGNILGVTPKLLSKLPEGERRFQAGILTRIPETTARMPGGEIYREQIEPVRVTRSVEDTGIRAEKPIEPRVEEISKPRVTDTITPRIETPTEIRQEPSITPRRTPETLPRIETKQFRGGQHPGLRGFPAVRIKTPSTSRMPTMENVESKFKALTPQQREGVIAWKQGWIYKMRYPPYGQSDIINSKKPLGGVQYYKDIGSAQKSVVLEKGDIPKDLVWDMGAIDVGVGKTKEGTKPVLKFVKDIQYGSKGKVHKVKGYRSNGKKHIKIQSLSKVK